MRKERSNESSFVRPDMPEGAKDTGTYLVNDNLGVVMQELEQVPDILAGGNRTRRFGSWFAIHVVPGLDKAATMRGPVILPKPPAVFIDADTLDQLRARLYFEIDVMIDATKSELENEATKNNTK